MPPSGVAGDTVRARLQLAVGAIAELRDERPQRGGRREFGAVARASGQALLVTVHPQPPAGPYPEALQRRIDQLRGIGHPSLAVPLASGALDGSGWTIESEPLGVSARERLARGPIAVRQGVSALRAMARALVTMHRRGVVHGAIDLDTVRLVGGGTMLHGAATSHEATVRDDLDAVGTVIWTLLAGEAPAGSPPSLSDIRRGVPHALDALCAALVAPSPERRPQHAEAILTALDAIPTRRWSPLSSIVDAGTHDARPRRRRGWAVAAAALLALVALLAITLR